MVNGYVSAFPKLQISLLIFIQDATLAYYAGYTEEELDPVVQLMVDYLARPVVHEAFFKKYASKKFLKGESSYLVHKYRELVTDTVVASMLARQWAKKNAHMFDVYETHLSLDQIS